MLLFFLLIYSRLLIWHIFYFGFDTPLIYYRTTFGENKPKPFFEMNFIESKNRMYVALQKLMSEEKVFTIQKLNRKSLASMLGTNEKYLFEILKEYTGLTYSEYILSLRLNYACGLLSDLNNNFLVEEVGSLAGFSSRKTFHRQFLKNYGMSPAQYRNKKKM